MRVLTGVAVAAVVVATAAATTGAVYATSGPVDGPPAEIAWSTHDGVARPAVEVVAVPISQEQGCPGGGVVDRAAGVTGLR